MKILYSLFTILLLCSVANGQKTTYNIDGMAFDTLNDPLVAATVLLLEKSDSTMVEFTRTDLAGAFNFRKVPNGNHLVKITYLGFIPITIDASSLDGTDVDLGKLEMVEIAEELMEVVIKAAKAPMKMRGDTLEYDATTFQVPEGSTVEDLLRRLPGIEVGQDGNILSDGKNVTRLTVDGKTFFGTDPKAATKNLPAQGISKVQVFDRKSEEEEITGISGESQEKEMNLELKEEFKKGGFGKVIGGLGTEERAELKGNYNKFNDKKQFSVVGVGNNTGRNGLSWDDYQDFMGSGAFNFDDDGDYGFGGGYRSISFGGDDNDDIESSIQGVFFGGRNNGGFPVNLNGGVNYNYDHDKTKFSSVYYYNQAGLVRESNGETQSFFEDFELQNSNFSKTDNVSRGHRAELMFEKEIDSLHTLKFNVNLAAMGKNNISEGETSLSRNNILTTRSAYENQLTSYGYLINTQAIFRKKFKKTGRRLGVNASFLNTSLTEDGSQESTNSFFGNDNMVDSLALINQLTDSYAVKNQLKTNAIFVEPLSKRFFFQSFYNFSTWQQEGDRDVLDVRQETESLNEILSRIYENRIMLNRFGSQLRFSSKKVNFSAGAAYQQFNLDGIYEGKGNAGIYGKVDRTFRNWIPYANINFSFTKTMFLSASYQVGTEQPSISNLQPIIDNRNPLFIREGNADLLPSVSHNGSINFRVSKPASALRFFINANYYYYENQIIQQQTVDENLVTYSTPINYSGGDQISIYSNLSIPLKANKLTLSLNYYFSNRNSFSFVNTILNKTTSTSNGPSVRLNITPNQNFSVYANANFNWTATKYDINTSQDQLTTTNTYSLEFNTKTFAGIFFNSNFNYQQFTNERFGFSQNVPVLNFSVYRRFMEGDRLEVRAAMYDAFNQNTSISQFASGNSITTSQTFALGRYVMVSLTYNLRGMSSDVRRDGFWF